MGNVLPVVNPKAEFILTIQAFFHQFLACSFSFSSQTKMRMRKSEMRMRQSDKKTLAFEYELNLRNVIQHGSTNK